MLRISFPNNCREERNWICRILIREFLGLDYVVQFDDQESTRIDVDGKTLELSDTFFELAAAGWLSPESLPCRPLKRWKISDTELDPGLVDSVIPIIFGAAGFQMRDHGASLNLDVFGSAFFMLSRYEEAVVTERDIHNRFPASASLAYLEGFLDRPIVDEYAEILWSALLRLCPRLTRKHREYRMSVSCDVDYPYHPAARSFYRMARSTLAKAVHSNGLAGISGPLRNYLSGRHGDLRNDPYYFMVDWIMDVNEKSGNAVLFSFIPEITDPSFDPNCSIRGQCIISMLKRIEDRQHEIGLHPGYRCYESVERTLSGLNTLQDVLHQAGIGQQVAGGRNHYLRWSTKTPSVWNAAGLQYDSTLAYADHPGFRCGTCQEFPMFDLHLRKQLSLREKPLICMDCSVVDYLGCGFTDKALAEIEKLKEAAQKVKGSFTLLWHNSYLEVERAQEIYREVIQ